MASGPVDPPAISSTAGTALDRISVVVPATDKGLPASLAKAAGAALIVVFIAVSIWIILINAGLE